MIVPITIMLMVGGAEPGWIVEPIPVPEGEVVEVGGIAFPDEHTIAVSTRRGRVWLIDGGLDEDPSDARWTRFADGLYEGLGLDTDGDALLVLQRGELSRLRDVDGDRLVDDIELVTDDWGLSDNYHEFAFGLPRDAQGNRYISFNLGFMEPEWWHGQAVVPYRGWIMQVSPEGDITPWAHGFRSPCGLGFDAEGRLLATDNQGDWMPTSPIYVVERDGFHGHPASLRWTEAFLREGRLSNDREPIDIERVPAAIWIPYEWSRSTGNLVTDTTGGGFGPFEGQLFVAELTTGRVLRAEIEDIDGVSQGAVWPFVDRVGSVARVAFAPDGSLICGLTNRGWGGLAPGHGLRRIRFTGAVPMEMKHVRLVPGGFDIEFTHPVAGDVSQSQVHVDTWDYNWWWKYGSPEQRRSEIPVGGTSLSPDRRILHLSLPMLRAGRVAKIRLDNISGDGERPLRHNEVAYTINRLPGGPSGQVAKMVDAPSMADSGQDESGWLRLMWGDATDLWEGDWRLAKDTLDQADRRRFTRAYGTDVLVNDEAANDLVLRGAAPDGRVSVAIMLPERGAIAMGLPGGAALVVRDLDGRGSIELLDSSGTILAVAERDVWRGPGQWHRLEVEIRNGQIEGVSLDDMSIMDEVQLPEGPDARWLRFLQVPGPGGIADVRLQPDGIKTSDVGEDLLAGRFELQGEVGGRVADGSMVLSGDGLVVLQSSCPAAFELHGTLRFTGDTAAALEVGGVSMVIAGSSPGTGSILGVDERSADLVSPGGWYDLVVSCSDGRITVSLNGLVVASGAASPNGPLAIRMGGGLLTIDRLRLDGDH
jgi:glucose/arabinose dehydrogenase